MKLSTTWICDTCLEPIESADDGWVEWIEYDDAHGKRRGRDLRLVHHIPASPRSKPHGCQHDERLESQKDRGILYDLSLTDFQGPNGLMRLLVMIHEDQLPRDDVLELIKRINIPGYEHARFHFDRAMAEGAFEPNMPPHFYFQQDIEAFLDFAEAHEE